MSAYNLKNLVKQKTCFKNPDKFPRQLCVWNGTLWLSQAYNDSLKTVFPEAKTENSKL